MFSVQFGWWKQFSCLCSVFFPLMYTCTQVIYLVVNFYVNHATAVTSWWNVLRTKLRIYFWPLILHLQVSTLWLLWGLFILSFTYVIRELLLNCFKKPNKPTNLVVSLPRNCSLCYGSLALPVFLKIHNIYVHRVSFVLCWLQCDKCEWWKVSLSWHLCFVLSC